MSGEYFEPQIQYMPKKVNYFTKYRPDITTLEKCFGADANPNAFLSEAQQKNSGEFAYFMFRDELLSSILQKFPKDLFFVSDVYRDAQGYPTLSDLPDLHMFMWNNYRQYFDMNGGWVVTPHEVMSTLRELYQHAEYREYLWTHHQEERFAELEYERNANEEQARLKEELSKKEVEDRRKLTFQNKQKKKGKQVFKEVNPMEEEKKRQAAKPKQITDLSREALEEKQTWVPVDKNRQPGSLVFIGHVDVGKSTICGNLMYLSGMIDQQTIRQYKKEAQDKGRDSWWLAYVMDTDESEKARGKTVEVGKTHFESKSKRYTVLDAPGHKNYVPNMIQGASMADVAGLVVSARKGEFEAGMEYQGQTREHAQLARALGVKKIIIVVNKMDEPTVKWSEERYCTIVSKVAEYLQKIGYSEEDISSVPVSGLTGDNMMMRSKNCPWYEGSTLVQTLDDIDLPDKDADKPIRVPIADTDEEEGGRKLIIGKVEQGTLRIGDKLTIAPNLQPCQITAILNAKEQLVRYAKPGESVKVSLRGIEQFGNVSKGDILCSRDDPTPVSEHFLADIQLFELLEQEILTKGAILMLHLHAIQEECQIEEIKTGTEEDEEGNIITVEKPKWLRSHAKAFVRISMRRPVCFEKYEVNPHLGQFTMRKGGRTIASGEIRKYKPLDPLLLKKYRQEETKQEE